MYCLNFYNAALAPGDKHFSIDLQANSPRFRFQTSSQGISTFIENEIKLLGK